MKRLALRETPAHSRLAEGSLRSALIAIVTRTTFVESRGARLAVDIDGAHQTRLSLQGLSADVLRDLGLPPGTPARAVFGDRDIYGSLVGRFRAENPDITTSILPNCGHVLWHDAPDARRVWLLDGLRACGLLTPAPQSSEA